MISPYLGVLGGEFRFTSTLCEDLGPTMIPRRKPLSFHRRHHYHRNPRGNCMEPPLNIAVLCYSNVSGDRAPHCEGLSVVGTTIGLVLLRRDGHAARLRAQGIKNRVWHVRTGRGVHTRVARRLLLQSELVVLIAICSAAPASLLPD